jgi:hypothetical protein
VNSLLIAGEDIWNLGVFTLSPIWIASAISEALSDSTKNSVIKSSKGSKSALNYLVSIALTPPLISVMYPEIILQALEALTISLSS